VRFFVPEVPGWSCLLAFGVPVVTISVVLPAPVGMIAVAQIPKVLPFDLFSEPFGRSVAMRLDERERKVVCGVDPGSTTSLQPDVAAHFDGLG
jgi:hypothetical protein